MSEIIYIDSVDCDLQSAKKNIKLARGTLERLSVPFKPTKPEMISTEIDILEHIIDNQPTLFAAYGLRDKEMVAVAEIGAVKPEQINPIDRKLGRLSVRLSQARLLNSRLISGLYINPESTNAKYATDSLINHMINIHPCLDTYVAMNDNDPALDSVLDNNFKETNITYHDGSNNIHEKIYVHSHNSFMRAENPISPIMLGYAVLASEKNKAKSKESLSL